MTIKNIKKMALVILTLLIGGQLATLPTYAQSLESSESSDSESTVSIRPVSYQLNSLEPENLMKFYTNGLGMEVLSTDDAGYYALGTTDGRLLLEIFPTDVPRSEELSTGLYHTAFLFTDRDYLGSTLSYLMQNGAPVEGLTHHIVSDAVYLADSEGNGIELYFDYPESEWEYADDGDIVMGNEPLDPAELMDSGEEEFTGLDERVSLGHFHLVVNDLEETGDFYGSTLGLHETSFTEGDSGFWASDNYHHHLAGNIWFGSDLPQPVPDAQGLRATVWEVESQTELDTVINALDQAGIAYELGETSIQFTDNSGLGVIVEIAQGI